MCAHNVTGRQANPVLTYITALRRFVFGMLIMVCM